MIRSFFLSWILLGVATATIWGQTAAEGQNQPPAQAGMQPAGASASSQPASRPSQAPVSPADDPTRLVKWLDYRGGIWNSAGMTGDWGGTRQELMDKGIRFDISLIQVLQGAWSGGIHTWPEYQGNVRYDVEIDTGKAGLWPGGRFKIAGETRYGNSDNLNVGSLSPVDMLSLYPQPGEPITALTEFYYVQFVCPQLGFLIGQVAPRSSNVFAHDETEQFMNASFNFDPVIATTYPITSLQAGVLFIPTDWFNVSTFVMNINDRAEYDNFVTAFKERGTCVFQQLEFTIKPFDLTGHQRVAWGATNKQYTTFTQNGRGDLIDLIKAKLGLGPIPTLNKSNSDWCIYYDFDQYFYNVPGKKDQGLGLFGGCGFTDGHVNPVGQFYDLGIGGKGMISGRDNDQFGAGFYYLSISEDLMSTPIIQHLNAIGRGLRDEQGVELYYNIAVTPWLHVTPDLQIIEPALRRVDTAVVAALRVKMDF